MRTVKTIVAGSLFVLVLFITTPAKSPMDAFTASTDESAQNIISTPTGGNWSLSSTWVGGAVPTDADNVTIATGATVTVDTSARAATVTVGSTGSRSDTKRFLAALGPAATLTFDETTARTLTILTNLTIAADGILATGGGSVNTHTISIGGSITNNGTLDLSTNGGQAGATIDFTGNSSATFGGTGAVTDIYHIQMDKASLDNIVELAPSNFTVSGTTTEGPASGFLYQNGGTFKISGTFTATHRTFSVDNYWPPATAGFWLNNPNYTVAASGQTGILPGGLRITAGEFNKGLSVENSLIIYNSFVMEGGRLNVAGSLWINNGTRSISGGKIVVCRSSGGDCTLAMGGPSSGTPPFMMSGGEIVVPNSAKLYADASPSNPPVFTGGTVRLGNELSAGPGTYVISEFTNNISPPRAYLPDTIVDTSSGFSHTVSRNLDSPLNVRNLTIGMGGIVQVRNLSVHGAGFVNNGQLEFLTSQTPTSLEFDDLTGLSDMSYSGTGTMTGTTTYLNVRCRNMTFEQVGSNLVSYNLKVTNAHLINAGRITLGKHDNTQSLVEIYDGASVDVSPTFDLGPNGEKLAYRGMNITGPEINPTRVLYGLTFTGPGILTLDGNLATTRIDFANGGIIKTGPATLSTQLFTAGSPAQNGYVDGNLRMQFAAAHTGHTYVFTVGQNGSSPVTFGPVSVSGASSLTIRAVNMTLPGLDIPTSASRYWTITEEGDLTGTLAFTPNAADIHGNQANYLRWRSNGGTPVQVPSGTIDQLTGDWGLGERLAPTSVSISGSVTTSTGMPIRNALVTISSSSLPAPMEITTGNFGSYAFQDLPTGGTYTVHVSAKRYRFAQTSQVVTAYYDVANVNFAANPEE